MYPLGDRTPRDKGQALVKGEFAVAARTETLATSIWSLVLGGPHRVREKGNCHHRQTEAAMAAKARVRKTAVDSNTSVCQ